ncbi:MAG: hypothetical protein IPL78_13530 [Chloroflexi bacterium]|nr:hypothetical protein [Chloroflexota bacterium]
MQTECWTKMWPGARLPTSTNCSRNILRAGCWRNSRTGAGQNPWQESDIQPTVAEQLKRGKPGLPALPTTGWEESTLLAVAMTDNPAQFIRNLIPVNLPLAARCANLPEHHPAHEKAVAGRPGADHNPEADLRRGLVPPKRW